MRRVLASPWGRLFGNWEKTRADESGYPHVVGPDASIRRTGFRALLTSIGVLGTCLKEAPEFSMRRRRGTFWKTARLATEPSASGDSWTFFAAAVVRMYVAFQGIKRTKISATSARRKWAMSKHPRQLTPRASRNVSGCSAVLDGPRKFAYV